MQLATGVYLLIGSAKHFTSGGICKVGINTNASSMPDDNAQMIYGHERYDVNSGCTSTIIALKETANVYFDSKQQADQIQNNYQNFSIAILIYYQLSYTFQLFCLLLRYFYIQKK